MLPSTGYFKALNCPFYENGYCERPYCHFKHTRRDVTSTGASESNRTVSKAQNASSSTVTTPDKDVIEKLVSEAVKKVLADQNVTDTDKIVDKVVEGLKPKLVPAVLASVSSPELPTAQSSCVYNPTPIAELKKRHISISSYEPTRESKAVRRKSPEVERPWMDVIRNISIEPKQKKVKYTPTAISQIEAERNSIHTYVPTAKSEGGYVNLYELGDDEYVPEKKRKKDRYFPKKKHREEYVPRRPKVSLKDDQRLDDDSFDVLELLGGSNSNDSLLDNEESKDFINTKTHQLNTDNDDIDIMEIDLTKDDKGNKEKEFINSTNYDSNNFNQINDEKLISKETALDKNKIQEKLIEDDSTGKDIKPSKDTVKTAKKEHDEVGKSNKNNEENLFIKSIHDDSNPNKSEDKAKDEKKDKQQNKEKDRHKHSSKSNVKEHTSSSKDNKSKQKDKDRSKDSKSSSHSSKSKDPKSDKKKSSSLSKDSKDLTKNSKDKHKHNKYDKKEKHKRSSSSERKKKSSKSSHKSSSKHSHSSHKPSKSIEKPTESDDGISDTRENRLDQEKGKCDSPEYEEFSPMYDEGLLEASDSEHDVEEECLKIFQEYEVSDHPKDVTSKAPPKLELEEAEETVKKRVAHPAAESNIIKSVGPSEPPKRLPSVQEQMYERWRQLKKLAAEKAKEKTAESKTLQKVFHKGVLGSTSTNDHQPNGNGRIRIAHVPYAKSLAREKEKVLEQAAKQTTSKTIAQTSKVGARVAHVPQVVPQLTRPEPLQTAGTQKFSLNVRQFYVNAMQDICIQIYTNSDDAAQRAVREEHACYEKCKALNVYKNSCMLTVHRLRKEVDQKTQQPTTSYGSISHAAVLAGKVKGTYSVIKSKKVLTDIKGDLLYNMLSKWILTEEELRENGFPRPHPDGPKGRAKLYVYNKRGQSNPSKVPNERYCCRCNKPYMVDKYNLAVRNENCIYHHARKFTFRGQSQYMCCKQDGSAEGCCDASTHVWDLIDPENLRGYVSTLEKNKSNHGVFALDCEMCYTTEGLELTRVTVINEDCEVIYETLVKPSHPIIDYNTRFSGISEKDMKDVTTSLLDVQATFLSMFSSKTILVGHSLESDFKALKLLHKTVVDTSVMFPHKNGPPFKRALKNLCSEHLRKIIQNDVSGHDSKEDAMACMELILWKVKEEAKVL